MPVAFKHILADIAITLLRSFGITFSRYILVRHLVSVESGRLDVHPVYRQDLAGKLDESLVRVELVLDRRGQPAIGTPAIVEPGFAVLDGVVPASPAGFATLGDAAAFVFEQVNLDGEVLLDIVDDGYADVFGADVDAKRHLSDGSCVVLGSELDGEWVVGEYCGFAVSQHFTDACEALSRC